MLDGTSLARADAIGGSGEASAVAVRLGPSESPRDPRELGLRAQARADISGGRASAEATESTGGLPAAAGALAVTASPTDAFVHAAHALSSDALATALAGNAAATPAFGRNADEILALVETGGGGDGERDIVLGSDIDFAPAALDVSSSEALLIGFLDPVLSGLKSIELRIELGEEIVFEISFADGAAAQDYFDDLVLSFGVSGGEALSIAFAMETMAGAPRASLDFLVATVPEPRALALLAVALAFLAWRASARRPRRGAASPRG